MNDRNFTLLSVIRIIRSETFCMTTDSEKKNWRIGKIIGKGGFGLIYLGNDFIFCVKAKRLHHFTFS